MLRMFNNLLNLVSFVSISTVVKPFLDQILIAVILLDSNEIFDRSVNFQGFLCLGNS